MKTLIIHIGYAKTGTTFLQKNVFPNLQINYIGRNYPSLNKILRKRLTSIIEYFPYLIHEDDEEKYQKFKNIFIKKIQNCGDKELLYSHEVLLRPYKIERIVKRIAEINKCFNVQILITIRDQRKIIPSRINHNAQINLNDNQMENILSEEVIECAYPACKKLGWKTCSCCDEIKKVSLPYYDYNFIISLFERKFKNIIILPAESFFQKDFITIKKILQNCVLNQNIFCDLINKSKLKNEAIDKNKYQQIKIMFDKRFEEKIFERYINSKRLLSQKYNLNLSKFGYFNR